MANSNLRFNIGGGIIQPAEGLILSLTHSSFSASSQPIVGSTTTTTPGYTLLPMMHAQPPSFESSEPGQSIPNRVLQGLMHLLEAHSFAQQFGVDRWQYGVELPTLLSVQMTLTDCRWLLDSHLAEAARETTPHEESLRQYEPITGHGFPPETCFVLSDSGVLFVRQMLTPRPVVSTLQESVKGVPAWDPERRELYYGPTLVKRFKLPAPNQERILSAFAEEGWPRRIDDPLPPKAGHDPKRRLHDTINSLNRNRSSEFIHFRGDGTGRGICWDCNGLA